MGKLMDGKLVAESIYSRIKENLDLALKDGAFKSKPKLVIIMVGNNAASAIYVNQKLKACEMLGFDCLVDHLEDASKLKNEDIIELIEKYNQDDSVNGILVQMPLPESLDKTVIIPYIKPEKDVDGLTPFSYGRTTLGVEFEYLAPCTARGVVKMLEYYKVPIEGQNVVVVGSGIIAGKPIAIMLSNRKATVTVCNSKTRNLAEITREADILIIAVGKAKMIDETMVKKEAVVVDVGISKDGLDKISGDVNLERVLPIVKYVSPVPGGVGKLTVACLMENLLIAALKG